MIFSTASVARRAQRPGRTAIAGRGDRAETPARPHIRPPTSSATTIHRRRQNQKAFCCSRYRSTTSGTARGCDGLFLERQLVDGRARARGATTDRPLESPRIPGGRFDARSLPMSSRRSITVSNCLCRAGRRSAGFGQRACRCRWASVHLPEYAHGRGELGRLETCQQRRQCRRLRVTIVNENVPLIDRVVLQIDHGRRHVAHHDRLPTALAEANRLTMFQQHAILFRRAAIGDPSNVASLNTRQFCRISTKDAPGAGPPREASEPCGPGR